MQLFTDQLNRTIALSSSPKRIISLVPSQTELLYDLGLGDRVVGITKFCIHPEEWFRNKARIGGTKTYNFDQISDLKPDLIIGNKEENEQVQIEQLMDLYPVWMSDIYTLSDTRDMIKKIGLLVNKIDKANALAKSTEQAFQQLPSANGLRVAYYIWRQPYMVAAQNTFITEMLEACGFKNCFTGQTRYPEISLDALKAAAPDCVFLSSEPYPFKEKHIEELKKVVPNAHICLVDGEAFSWYGSRLLKSIPYLVSLIEDIKGAKS